MTRHDRLLAEVLLREIEGLDVQQAVARLFESGLVSRRACERQAIRCEVERLQRLGTPRCEALHVAAELFDCSYEKARGAIYNTFKN